MVASLIPSIVFLVKDNFIVEKFKGHHPHPHPRPHPKPEPEPEDRDLKIKRILNLMYSVITIILTFYAIFLSFKRNNGFDLGSFLLACCFGPCYVLYALAVPISAPVSPPMLM